MASKPTCGEHPDFQVKQVKQVNWAKRPLKPREPLTKEEQVIVRLSKERDKEFERAEYWKDSCMGKLVRLKRLAKLEKFYEQVKAAYHPFKDIPSRGYTLDGDQVAYALKEVEEE